MADNNRAVVKLKEKFPAAIMDVKEFRGEVTVTVVKDQIVEICRFMKDSLGFNLLTDLTCVDYLGSDPRFMVVYQLYSVANKDRIRLKAGVGEADTSIGTVTSVWSGANWLEREAFDMFGVVFNGHPDLRRILMTDDWEGYPLRKDYPLQGPDREPYKGRLS